MGRPLNRMLDIWRQGVTRYNHSGKSKEFLKYLEAGNDTGCVEGDQVMQGIVLLFACLFVRDCSSGSLSSHHPPTALVQAPSLIRFSVLVS